MGAAFYGLTGGIASGKSTVSSMFRELGAAIVNADELAREVVRPGQPALDEIVARFGQGVLTRTGVLDRAKLGAIVFRDAVARQALGAITHPRIGMLAAQRAREAEASGAEMIFYEAALLVENGIHRTLPVLVVVSVPPEVQLVRLMGRDGLSEVAARARLEAQLPLAEKIAVATHVIDNSGTRQQTRAQVSQVWTSLQEAR